MNTDDKTLLRDELLKSFDKSYIRNAGLLIHKMAEDFYEKYELSGAVYFNEDIFSWCLIDILVDLARLKHFHDIENVNYNKLIAYSASWCLKRKPFQIIEGTNENNIYVNEEFALTMLAQASGLRDHNAKYVDSDKTKISTNLDKIFYHLKYRNTNPQTLELLLTGIETGKLVNISDN